MIAAFALLLGALVILPGQAIADGDCDIPPGETRVNPDPQPGESKYYKWCPGDGEGGGGDWWNDGEVDTSCDRDRVAGKPNRHCFEGYACWTRIPSIIPEDEWPNDPPTPEAYWVWQICPDRDPEGKEVWYVDEEVGDEDQAEVAFGRLKTPDFTLEFGPYDTLAYVGMDSHFWVDGPGDDEIVGDSALGVVAIGTPKHIEVEPGDGSDIIECPWSISVTDDCLHAYLKRSLSGTATVDGQPAYTARARLVYSVRFENNGEEFEPPGMPETLESPWESVPVPVGEIQVIVE